MDGTDFGLDKNPVQTLSASDCIVDRIALPQSIFNNINNVNVNNTPQSNTSQTACLGV